MRHSYWLATFCTTNSSLGLARESKIMKILGEKTHFFLNILYVYDNNWEQSGIFEQSVGDVWLRQIEQTAMCNNFRMSYYFRPDSTESGQIFPTTGTVIQSINQFKQNAREARLCWPIQKILCFYLPIPIGILKKKLIFHGKVTKIYRQTSSYFKINIPEYIQYWIYSAIDYNKSRKHMPIWDHADDLLTPKMWRHLENQ